jgi:hypothetical protein
MNASNTAYRFNILALLACSQAIAYIDRVNFAVVGPHLIRDYHYTPAQVGTLMSVFNWAFTGFGHGDLMRSASARGHLPPPCAALRICLRRSPLFSRCSASGNPR